MGKCIPTILCRNSEFSFNCVQISQVSGPLCAETFLQETTLILRVTNCFLSSLPLLNRDNNEPQMWIEVFKLIRWGEAEPCSTLDDGSRRQWLLCREE